MNAEYSFNENPHMPDLVVHRPSGVPVLPLGHGLFAPSNEIDQVLPAHVLDKRFLALRYERANRRAVCPD